MQAIQQNKKKVNQSYIAKKLDLSVGTVSKALRNQPEISNETAQKIREFAQSVGYSKLMDSIADKTASGHLLAGVLINSSTYRAARGGYLEGISKESIERNFSILTHYVSQDESKDLFNGHIPWAIKDPALVSGVILIHNWPSETVGQLSKDYACVSIMHDHSNCGVDYVGVNGESGIFTLVNYLYKKGCRQIGFFGHNKDLSWSRSRFSGYMNAICKFGLKMSSNLIVEVEKEYPEESKRNWNRHFDHIAEQVNQGADAWVCASELAAYELYNGLKERGLSVPGDVAITGFDSNPNNGVKDINVTSMKVPSEQMGAAALAMVQNRKNNPNLPRQVQLFDCDFIKGETA